MVGVGSLRSLPGALVGVRVLILAPELTRGAGHLRTVLVGLVLYLSILLLPGSAGRSLGTPPRQNRSPLKPSATLKALRAAYSSADPPPGGCVARVLGRGGRCSYTAPKED